jgi:hypothetical protein
MKPDEDQKNEMSECEIDKNIEDSFPASDPPSWTLGTDHGTTASGDDVEPGDEGVALDDR